MSDVKQIEKAIEATVSLLGAQIVVGCRGGLKVHGELVARPDASGTFGIWAWGTSPDHVLRLQLGDVVYAHASEVETIATYRAICARQRTALDGDPRLHARGAR
jgi:hypothetical protein